MNSTGATAERLAPRAPVFSADARCVRGRVFSNDIAVTLGRSRDILPCSPSLAFRFVFVAAGPTVRAFAIATGAHVFTLTGHTAAVTDVALHPTNRRQVVTVSLDGTLRAWDADDGACLRVADVGAPLVRLAAPTRWPGDARPVAYVAALQRRAGGASGGGDYPLGDEVACLRPRPLATSFAFTVDATGRRRAPPLTTILEVDLSSASFSPAAPAPATRVVAERSGFVVGLAAAAIGPGAGGEPARAVVFGVRDRLFVWRSDGGAAAALTEYRHAELLTTVRPREGGCRDGAAPRNLCCTRRLLLLVRVRFNMQPQLVLTPPAAGLTTPVRRRAVRDHGRHVRPPALVVPA